MKKVLAMLCAASLALSLGATALADPAEEAENLARMEGAEYFASHASTTGNVLENAFDGNLGSRYGDPGNLKFEAKDVPYEEDVFVGVKFPELTQITDVTIVWQGSRAVQSAEGYWLEVTTDGSAWTKVEGATYTYGTGEIIMDGNPEPVGDHYLDTIQLAAPQKVLGVRVFVQYGNDQYSPSIWEFEVYNNAAVTPETYEVKVQEGIAGGKVTLDKATAAAGETVTVTVTPDEGKQLKAGSLKVNGTAIEQKDGKYTFEMPAAAATVTAEFEDVAVTPETYEAKVQEGIAGGKVTLDKATAAAGETVTVTVTPDEGKQLKAGSLKVNGTAIEQKDGKYTFEMPAAAVTVTAEFEDVKTPGGEEPEEKPGDDKPDVPDTGVGSLTAVALLAGGAAAGVAATKKRGK